MSRRAKEDNLKYIDSFFRIRVIVYGTENLNTNYLPSSSTVFYPCPPLPAPPKKKKG